MSMSHYHPFQKLCHIIQSGDSGLLLAAAGPYILSLDLKNGGVLLKWPNDVHESSERQAEEGSRNGDFVGNTLDGHRPTKRRKLSFSQEEEEQDARQSSVSIEFVSERAKGQRRKKKIVKSSLPNVSHVLSTVDGRHVVAVTAEDKCIRVFELDSLGHLKLLSERQGSRPTSDVDCAYCCVDSTILAGDKFGDVYALPLHPTFNLSAASPSKPRLELPKPPKPSATEFTVHTKGNREALRQQQLQRAAPPKKQAPTFEHQLILGHVSLLTDLAVGADPSSDSREYILTADRDEHIRVSRGIPQVHIINNYCQGHTEFINKLCIVPERPEYLISGGGEPSLRIYDWLRGTTVAEANLEENLKQLISNSAFSGLPESNGKRAVSCIRALHIEGHDNREEVIIIVVALEGTPFISTCLFYPATCLLKQDRQHTLNANVLEIIIIKNQGIMLVSLDNIHAPLSMKKPISHPLPPIISAFEFKVGRTNGAWQYEWLEYSPPIKGHGSVQRGSFDDIASKLTRTLQSEDIRHEIEVKDTVKPEALYSQLGEFLYGLESLRKKTQGDGEVQQAEELAATDPEA